MKNLPHPDRKLDSRVILYGGEQFYHFHRSSVSRKADGPGDGAALLKNWLEYRNSATDFALIKERLGVEVLLEDAASIFKNASRVQESQIDALVEQWIGGATSVEGDPREIMAETARWYIALKEDLQRKDAIGFTTICSELETRYGCNPCFAFMMLCNEGYHFACGIDLNGLLTELMLSACGAGPVFQGNLLVQNLERGIVSIRHCGVPSMMDEKHAFNLRHVHSNPGAHGYASDVHFRREIVTLARLSPGVDFVHGSRCTLVDYLNHRDRCINEAILRPGSPRDFEEHRIKPRHPSRLVHYAMCYGDHVDRLEDVATAIGITCLRDG